jgi:hypothetical protein
MLAGMSRSLPMQPPVDLTSEALDARTRARLLEIADWLAARPWNRPGTDKRWVLAAMSESLAFHAQVVQAERVRNP